jgi:hypothetical protein
VPNLWDKTANAFPQSELNPLTNPTLERNLNRWAQVYFSSPPDRREQAVSKLLEAIKREASEGLPAHQDRPYFAHAKEFDDVVCPACQRKNPPRNKFCAGCGEVLNPALSDSSEDHGRAPMQGSAEAPSAKPESDIQWLRNRTLGSLDASDAQKQRGSRYLVGALVIALAGFAYLQWAPSLPTSLRSPGRTAAPRPSVPAAPLPAEDSPQAEIKRPPETISPDPKGSGVHDTFATPEVHDRRPLAPGLQPAVQRSPLFDVTISRRPVDAGVSDLRLAQRYLGGSMGARDSSEAAKLLWKAVRKQNVTAAVLLSDLYVRGDGVPKSCDQARLLLVAAAKRGAPLAAQQLRSLESHGCQ